MSDNLKLWNSVCKTDPKHTKSANVRGNKITAIAPQSQIMAATEAFGPYGLSWGFNEINFDYAMLEKTGIVVFKGTFFYSTEDKKREEFPITSSISAYKDGAMTKPDADFAKKVETDALTKALSKIGFNADVFMGMYDDNKYVQLMKEEFNKPVRTVLDAYNYNLPCINGMREAFDKQDYTYFIQCWDEITGDSEADVNTGKNDKTLLWVAPTKYKEHGLPEPVFTTEQRTFLKENATKYRESK